VVRKDPMLSYPLGEEFERYEQPTVDLEGARVLIFGINYWPEPTGIAPYTTEIAEYMAARGARVKVIAGLPHYPDWRVAPPYDKGFRFRQVHNGVEIIRLRHSVPGKMTVARRAAYEASYFAHAVLQTFSEHPDLIAPRPRCSSTSRI
jgi:colanic acid biosynthesis glycosyl transferase WcaI